MPGLVVEAVMQLLAVIEVSMCSATANLPGSDGKTLPLVVTRRYLARLRTPADMAGQLTAL
jgi:hypothetical protein